MKSYPQHTAGLKSCNLLFESSIKCKKKQFYTSKLFIVTKVEANLRLYF